MQPVFLPPRRALVTRLRGGTVFERLSRDELEGGKTQVNGKSSCAQIPCVDSPTVDRNCARSDC
jgi:hypothetical protein